MRHSSIMTTEAGLISGNLYKIPNRWFLPSGLHQTSCDADHLDFVDSNIERVLGSAIGLSQKDSIASTLGEFFERYCSAYQLKKNLVQASYEDLTRSGRNALSPKSLKYYADWQMASGSVPYKRFTVEEQISWIEGRDMITGENILVPAFSVFLPHNRYFDNNNDYLLNTSTGVAAGRTTADAIRGGFLECVEREAFSQFWYRQNEILDQIPAYSSKLILAEFDQNPVIRQLFDNPKVRLMAFDLSGLVPVETVVVFLYFKYKGRVFQSMGAASRFSKTDAIIKAALEAYQGVEYAILVDKKEAEWTINKADYSNVDDFSRHFAFYNRFPELREAVPMLRRAQEGMPNTDEIVRQPASRMMQSMDELPKVNLERAIYVDITTPDARESGYEVVRVITPGWSLLTGMHDRPFLGANALCADENLFLTLPHPFP